MIIVKNIVALKMHVHVEILENDFETNIYYLISYSFYIDSKR